MIYYGQPGPFAESVEEKVFDAIRRVLGGVGAKSSPASPYSSSSFQATSCIRGTWNGPFQRLPLSRDERRPSRCR